jgi:CRP/FNR family transcriptional regulator, anaerobic regulatory protein
MNSAHMMLVAASRLARLLHPEVVQASAGTEISFLETICGQAGCLQLRPQQRVPMPPAGKIAVLREGVLALDAMPMKGKLQVLDFLQPGDVVSASTVLSTPGISLRAITRASLVLLDPPGADSTLPTRDYWTFLIEQCCNQLARVNLHQLMIGRLETAPRIASFILSLALRSDHKDAGGITVMLPMSRTDIANYLVINCDTLSRTMMRFCDAGIVERVSRHAIRVRDIDALRTQSPLAAMLSTMLETQHRKPESRAEPGLKSVWTPTSPDGPCMIPPAAEIGPSTRSGAGIGYAFRQRNRLHITRSTRCVE